MARNPAADRARRHFADLFAGHLRSGTRPAKAAGEPWTDTAFAGEVQSSRENGFVSPRTVSNWRKGTALPVEIEPILRALFGPSDRHAAARDALRAAFQAARDEKAATLLKRAKRDPAGGRWVVQDDTFVLDRTTRPTDRRAAADPLRQQLQQAIRKSAATLAERAQRLANTRSWGGLSGAAADFTAVVDCDPLRVPDQLGEAYAALLQLGTCLETDTRLQRDPARLDEPLDADIHANLSHLVRLAAPWLRGFPTVAAWDDAAGRALARPDLFQPARAFIRIARAQRTISDRDAAEIENLAGTAEAGEFQGGKAGTRAVGHATNLLLAEAEVAAAARAETGVTGARTLSPVAERALATLAAAQAEITRISAAWPEALRFALRSLVQPAQLGEDIVAPPAILPAIPDDVERQARDLILAGQALPPAWQAYIQALDFFFTPLNSLDLLAGLTALQSLDLRNTQVSDLSPLAGLTTLQRLDLRGTLVTDLSPLADLKATILHDLSEPPPSRRAPSRQPPTRPPRRR